MISGGGGRLAGAGEGRVRGGEGGGRLLLARERRVGSRAPQ